MESTVLRLTEAAQTALAAVRPAAQAKAVSVTLAAVAQLPDIEASESAALAGTLEELLRRALECAEPGEAALSLDCEPAEGGQTIVHAAVSARGRAPAPRASTQRAAASRAVFGAETFPGAGFILWARMAVQAPAAPASDRHVLICDDDALCNEMVSVILNEGGFRVSVAEDGDAGLKAIRNLKPSIVLLDIDMPVKTGLDVLRDLKQSPIPGAPAVVVLSNHESAELQSLCKTLGAHETMTKPFVIPELIQRLEDLIKERKAKP